MITEYDSCEEKDQLTEQEEWLEDDAYNRACELQSENRRYYS